MALADIPPGGPPRRLDSWKEIAEYLRRDVRTATRWESQGLPLHRVAGGKGRSVFAFTNEIDAWMASHPAVPQAGDVVIEQVPVPAGPETSPRRLRAFAISAAWAVVMIGIGAVVMSSGGGTPIQFRPEITVTGSHVSITDASGASRVIHEFKPEAELGQPRQVALSEDLNADGAPEILTAVSAYLNKDDGSYASGELLNLTADGLVLWRFGFDDVMTFAGGSVSGPWAVADWQVEPNAPLKRVAVAGRDTTWWASVVAVLNPEGQRLGSFVNPGWIESVLWRSPDRLAIAGFNNDRQEGMFAMLDANRLGGQAPGTAGTDYACLSCPSTAPIFYATFARSELNLVAPVGFVRARLSTAGDRLLVHTLESGLYPGDAIGIYEFDRDLRLLTARYSDSYWDAHRRLEREGHLTHTREKCPERDGPAAIHVWDSARGWVRTTPSGGT